MKTPLHTNILAVLVCALFGTQEALAQPFTELNPAGGIQNGKFEEVHFYNGNCADGTRALNKLSMKQDVLVIKGATRDRSPLLTDGKQVFVSVNDEQIKIGDLSGPEGFELDQTISFDLMVYDKDGNAKAWKFGDKAQYAKEEIAVFL